MPKNEEKLVLKGEIVPITKFWPLQEDRLPLRLSYKVKDKEFTHIFSSQEWKIEDKGTWLI